MATLSTDATTASEQMPPPAPPSVAPPVASTSSSAPMAQRRFTVFKPAGTPAPLPDLPDSYFEPTVGELARAHSSQVSKRERLVDGPLLTRKLRDEAASKDAAAKRARFPHTRIRVKFADRTQLETSFTSASHLPAVYAAIRESFAEEHRQTPFVLYQTPPKRDFAQDDPKHASKSLYDLQLAPSSVFYIRFAVDALNDPSRSPPLRPELLDAAEDIPAPPAFDESALKREPAKAPAEPLAKTKAGTALPKWLKTGKSAHK